MIDSNGTWLAKWEQKMRSIGCKYLRTPSTLSPHPKPGALRDFITASGRDKVKYLADFKTSILYTLIVRSAVSNFSHIRYLGLIL